jgi:hypothetical protein
MLNNTYFFRRALLMAGLLLGVAALPAAHAQPGSGGPGTSAPAATDVPVDGGASLLLASGIGYGLSCFRQVRRQRKS